MSETKFDSYAGKNKAYEACDSIDDVIKILEKDSIRLFKWLLDIKMKANRKVTPHCK